MVLVAHEIPRDVTAHLILKPEAGRMLVAVRIPLGAIRDLEFPATAQGHLDIDALSPRLPQYTALWIGDYLEIHENGIRQRRHSVIGARISIESDRSFSSIESAAANIMGPPLRTAANVDAEHVWLDALLDYPVHSAASSFAVRPGLHHLGANVITALRYVLPGGSVRGFQFAGDPGAVPLDPSLAQASWRFIRLGFFHILDGTDHLLFLACLVIPFRRWRPLVMVVTAFTIAHSITLLASAFDLAPGALWFPALIETLIAVSIVYMALENIVGASEAARRWLIAFGFGLIHGFGFSFGLRETLQFAGSHLLASLVCFNLGVELGQLAVLVALIPVLNFAFSRAVPERMGTIVTSAIIAHTGLHWTAERWDELTRYTFERPVLDTWFWVRATRGLAIAVALGGLLSWVQRRIRASTP